MSDDTAADQALPRELHVAFETAVEEPAVADVDPADNASRKDSTASPPVPAEHASFVPPTDPADEPIPSIPATPAFPGMEAPAGRSWTLPVETVAPAPPSEPPPDPSSQERRPQRGWLATIGLVFAGSVLGAALALGVGAWLAEDDPSPPVTVVERVQTRILTPEESGTPASAVAERVLPSIVAVEISAGSSGPFLTAGSGSGVVLTSGGRIVTNAHVVESSGQVRVVFPDGRTYEARVLGEDALTDIALLEIDATGLQPIELGSTTELAIGDPAIAVGNPLGLTGGPSVTVGVVSAFDRRVQTSIDSELFGMLQTDAPITRGSSGGALVDREGRLIGITTAIGVSDVGAEGLGFAVPVELMTKIADDLLEFGEARHPFLGITGVTEFVDTGDGAVVPGGVSVSSVLTDTAAELAGIQPGDVILSFDGNAVVTMDQLIVDLRRYRVGDIVTIEILRNGETSDLAVTLLQRPEV